MPDPYLDDFDNQFPDDPPISPLLTCDIRHIVASMHGITRTQRKTAMAGLELVEKAHRVYLAAIAAGWSLDEDEWWWRPMKAGDKHFDECHFGFTEEHSRQPNCVFVRCPTYALAYDRGEIIPYRTSHLAFKKTQV